MNAILNLYFNDEPIDLESRTADRFTTARQRFHIRTDEFNISGIVRFAFSLKNAEVSDVWVKAEFDEVENISVYNAKEHLKSLLEVRYSL